MSTPSSFKITLPDDWHVHLRDGAMLATVLRATPRFGRALVMPNLKPPIRTLQDVLSYQARILEHAPSFTPLMTIKIDPQTTADIVAEAKAGGVVAGKLYPDGVTTNSENGVRDFETLYPVFQAMQDCGLVLSLHGETPNPTVDCIDAETIFIRDILSRIERDFPRLRIVLEHITTEAARWHVEQAGPNVAATITPHHLVITMNDVRRGTFKPHLHCLPEAKRFSDRRALRQAATRGSTKFFLGTDSAPHAKHTKECATCCAGIFNAPVAMSVLASVFEEEAALDKLEGFTSLNGAHFYGFEPNTKKLELFREDWTVPELYEEVVPFKAGETLPWRTQLCS